MPLLSSATMNLLLQEDLDAWGTRNFLVGALGEIQESSVPRIHARISLENENKQAITWGESKYSILCTS